MAAYANQFREPVPGDSFCCHPLRHRTACTRTMRHWIRSAASRLWPASAPIRVQTESLPFNSSRCWVVSSFKTILSSQSPVSENLRVYASVIYATAANAKLGPRGGDATESARADPRSRTFRGLFRSLNKPGTCGAKARMTGNSKTVRQLGISRAPVTKPGQNLRKSLDRTFSNEQNSSACALPESGLSEFQQPDRTPKSPRRLG